MKRSALRRGKPLKARTQLKRTNTPLTRGAPLKARKRVNPVSTKTKARNAEYSKQRRVFLRANPRCVFPGCLKPSTDVHHVESRGVNPARIMDTTNWVGLCRPHHAAITADPELGYRLGLMKRSTYERN